MKSSKNFRVKWRIIVTRKIKFLRSDRRGEYLSYEFGLHLKQWGTVSQLTPPGTPQRNSVSKRRNRTLLDMVRSMMYLTDLPLSFWVYALEIAAFTLNRAPYKSVETTPYELWFGKKHKLSFLKVWGCDAYVKTFHPDKFKPKSEKCVFIGYPKESWVHLLSQIRRQDIRCLVWILSRERVSLERSEWEESRT